MLVVDTDLTSARTIGKGTGVEITGLITAVIIGAIIGGLGRAVAPGGPNISVLLTILIGIGAALLGTGLATVIGVADTAGIDWIELFLQVGLSGAGVTLVSRAKDRNNSLTR
jgi:uncharacterized membrane protein YeaQ/YmgE (transglycosylase-associated protein family)